MKEKPADCYPSLKTLSDGIRSSINATTMFSFWPEAMNASAEFSTLLKAGCLINPDLYGLAIDSTIPACRSLIWTHFLKPRYYEQGVSAYWLDETDGEGSNSPGDGPWNGYDTSWGPDVAYSNLWVNDWLSIYSDPIAKLGTEPPLVLTRGVWAGGQRHGAVLWSSDILSSFEELAAMVPQGVHTSLSGIPWWCVRLWLTLSAHISLTFCSRFAHVERSRFAHVLLTCLLDVCNRTTDVGGYFPNKDNHSPYMQELIVRWYQFGAFCPIFRTHSRE